MEYKIGRDNRKNYKIDKIVELCGVSRETAIYMVNKCGGNIQRIIMELEMNSN